MEGRPPVEIGEVEMSFLGTLRERDRRCFTACKATKPNGGSVKAACKAFGCSPDTVTKAVPELSNHIVPTCSRRRMPGGGAKRYTVKHPEWVEAFEGVVRLDVKAPQIRRDLIGMGCDVSELIIRQTTSQADLKREPPPKSLPLDVAENRDAQSGKFGPGTPTASTDTRKKVMTGSFRRDGQVHCTADPKSLDHDSGTSVTKKRTQGLRPNHRQGVSGQEERPRRVQGKARQTGPPRQRPTRSELPHLSHNIVSCYFLSIT